MNNIKLKRRVITYLEGEPNFQGYVSAIIGEHYLRLQCYSWLTGEKYGIKIIDIRTTPLKVFSTHNEMLEYLERLDSSRLARL
jgi:hypothetical protein